MWDWMLVRAAGTGSCPHTASINESTDPGRLRLIRSMASTARCFGAPNGTCAPLAVISNGPSTPNPRPAFFIALPASPGFDGHFRALAPILNAWKRRRLLWRAGRAAIRARGSPGVQLLAGAGLERGQHTLGDDLVEQAYHPLDGQLVGIRIRHLLVH